LTGLPDRPGQIFLKQNEVVLVKKKSTGYNRVFDWVLPSQPSHTRFFLPLFFLQPGTVQALGQPSSELNRRAGFQNYDGKDIATKSLMS